MSLLRTGIWRTISLLIFKPGSKKKWRFLGVCIGLTFFLVFPILWSISPIKFEDHLSNLCSKMGNLNIEVSISSKWYLFNLGSVKHDGETQHNLPVTTWSSNQVVWLDCWRTAGECAVAWQWQPNCFLLLIPSLRLWSCGSLELHCLNWFSSIMQSSLKVKVMCSWT